jgi:chloramphenicol 3-O phosphotransferase
MLIVLFGTSSSGKTSIAQALQLIWPTPLLDIEADRLIPTIAEERFHECDDNLKERLVLAMHEAIAAFGRSGIDTIADGSMPGQPDLRDRCIKILRDAAPTKLVAVRCSLDELRAREAARADRIKGWAEEQSKTLYDGVEFDYSIDTTAISAGDCARGLLRELYPD